MNKSKTKKSVKGRAVKKKDVVKGKIAKKKGGEKKSKKTNAKGKEKKPKKVEKQAKRPEEEKKAREKKKDAEVKKLQEKLKKKKKKVTFRGHFGKRSVRRRSKEKWDKWHKPRGKDFKLRKEDGKVPRIGYRTNKALRYLHPSGYKEVLIHNVNELEMLANRTNVAARIASAVGRKKREKIIKRANALGIKILNA